MDCSKKTNKEGRALGTGDTGVRGIPKADSLLIPPAENAVMATTSVFVVEPGEDIGEFSNHNRFGHFRIFRKDLASKTSFETY